VTNDTRRPFRGSLATAICSIVGLNACGGGTVSDPPLSGTQSQAFAYFQLCVNPIFLKNLPNPNGGTPNTCSAGGCHNNVSGTGGAFRIIPTAQPVDLTNPANTPDVIKTTDMYKNFYSAQGEVVTSSPTQSLLVNKPLLRNVLHGGGLIFASDQDPNIKVFEYWISNPAPQGQDAFSTATYGMFTPPYPAPGAMCNTN
jgi:hypothetical protein